MRLNRVLVLGTTDEQQLQNAAFWKLCFHLSDIQKCPAFSEQPVHEFCGLKVNQMSKVRASSHEYPHVEKSRIFGNRILKVRWPTTVTAKELTSRQKEKPHGKKNNHYLTAKKLQLKRPRYRRNFAVSLFLFAVSLSFCREVFVFAASLFLFAAPWGYSFCRDSCGPPY